jgi:predicted RNase H-like nuclease (RuvC/YqgF family)
MAGLETRVDKLDERVTSLEQRVAETTANVNGLIRELKDFKDEMRQQNKMRAEDVREIRAGLDNMGKHVRNLSLTAMGAIGAMVVTVIISLLKN